MQTIETASDQQQTSRPSGSLTAVIGKYRQAQGLYDAACGSDENHPDLDRLLGDERAAFRAVCAHPVSTLEDVREKAAVLLQHAENFALPTACYESFLKSLA